MIHPKYCFMLKSQLEEENIYAITNDNLENLSKCYIPAQYKVHNPLIVTVTWKTEDKNIMNNSENDTEGKFGDYKNRVHPLDLCIGELRPLE